MKNLTTLAGIEPATFQFVAQHLNHCATAVPKYFERVTIFLPYLYGKKSACAILYGSLWPVQLHYIFCTYPINDSIFGKKVIEHKNVFSISVQLLTEIYLILK